MEFDKLPELLSPDKFSLLLRFFVPGLVKYYARGQLVGNRRQPFSEVALSYVALSLVYQALVLPLTTWLDGLKLKGSPLSATEILVAIVLPAVFGFLLGLNARKGWTRRVLQLFGITLNHPIDAAWDWRFTECVECWVLAVLKDGTQWAGHLGTGSFMSTDPTERDIFIETVYEMDDQDRWTYKGSGLWIAHGELQTLEFWPYLGGEFDGGKQSGAAEAAAGGTPPAKGESAEG